MSRAIRPAILLAVFLTYGTIVTADSTGNINLFLGGKFLDEDDWPGGDTQGEFGVLATVGSDSWPVYVAIDVLGSTEDVHGIPGVIGTLEQWTLEFDVGVRKIWERGKARPFLGGGAAWITGGRDLLAFGDVVLADDDSALGVWACGGVFWRLGTHFNLGFEARVSRAKINLEGDVEAGGEHVGLLLGWGW